ncbi:MAG: hypothetical protein GY795_05010 [Desulfobacterales bacterium]|nr:hypothetical protein [Desulfobacterales bacterium]
MFKSEFYRKVFIFAVTAAALCSLALCTAGLSAADPGDGKLLQFTAGGHVICFQKDRFYMATGTHMLSVEFAGTEGVMPESADPEGLQNLQGLSKKAAPPLGSVIYPDLYKGITLTYDRDSSSIMKSTWRIEPSASPDTVRMRYNVPVRLMEDGGLRLDFETGTMSESAPVAWQEIRGDRIPVDVAFSQHGPRDIGFSTGAYDTGYPLFIDPALIWNTFMGAANLDSAYAAAVDGGGNMYVAGMSSLTWGAPVNALAGGADGFVVKLNSSGVRQWNTFMGGDWY